MGRIKGVSCFRSIFLIPNVDFIITPLRGLVIIDLSFTGGLHPSFLYDVPSGLVLLLHNIIAFRNALKGHHILTQGKAL